MSDTSTASLPQVTHSHRQEVDARNRLVIGVLLASTFVVILNETIMSVALPHLMDDFDIEASAAQWLTTAFLLTMAVVIPITGFLLQRVSTRAVFVSAMSFFSVGTLIAAIAPGFEVLVAARVVQALGTAIMIPLLFTTVFTLVPAERRGRVMGNVSIVISVAPAVGPTVSGLILSALSWRWMFIIVLPVAVLALVVGVLRIPNVSEPRKTPLDYVSVVLSAIGFGGLVFGLSHIGETEAGISSPTSWAPLALGAAGIALFILRQLQLQRTDRALLDLRTFTSSGFTLAIAVIAIYTTIWFGTLTLLPIYTQNVLELDALTTGLLMLPGGLVMGVLAPFVGRLYDKVGPTVLVVPGSIIVSGALWFMTTLGAGSSIVTVLVAHIVLSIGLALTFTPLFTSGLASLGPRFYSHGSATVSTVQQLAGAVGIAVFFTVMTATSTRRIEDGASVVAATADGIHAAFVCGAVLSLIAIPLAFFIRKPASSGAPVPVGH
ncbi:Riboflavin transporter RibZ [Arthrobacter sp. Bi83]|uniref:MDR family MFS transporter n=1 Tax=Arthrobacter sp. Bi83 TaxID=2822353 RepID=UPI001DE7D8C7|nr:MDR family MFS transporter [Arthrobacter sp. Bi83]CAH0125680.1 Riboflavin transporter RibZ [Arthrobacter sp. Bi83]